MLKALFLQSNHANEPPEQLFLLNTATIQITSVFYIKFIHSKQSHMIFYKATLNNHIIRDILNHLKQNNPY